MVVRGLRKIFLVLTLLNWRGMKLVMVEGLRRDILYTNPEKWKRIYVT